MDRTTDEIRTALALAVGWTTSEVKPGGYFWCPPGGGRRVAVSALPDFANDLNAMAAVEQALIASGRWPDYLQALIGHLTDRGPAFNAGREAAERWLDAILLIAVTAPAAVRALAAYRVLEAKP
jgi:hypothetical protein